MLSNKFIVPVLLPFDLPVVLPLVLALLEWAASGLFRPNPLLRTLVTSVYSTGRDDSVHVLRRANNPSTDPAVQSLG